MFRFCAFAIISTIPCGPGRKQDCGSERHLSRGAKPSSMIPQGTTLQPAAIRGRGLCSPAILRRANGSGPSEARGSVREGVPSAGTVNPSGPSANRGDRAATSSTAHKDNEREKDDEHGQRETVHRFLLSSTSRRRIPKHQAAK